MADANYPYLDLTVLADIRNHIIAPNAAVLFDPSLSQILWLNGEGAKLIGSPTVRPALENTITANPAMMRQITTAVGKLASNDEASAIMRVSKGFQSQLLGFTVRTVKLPKGESAVLLLTESLHGKRYSKEAMASAAVDCLDGYGHASAILSADGTLIASSEHFGALNVAAQELMTLVQEVSNEDDRLVKRLIETKQGRLATGIARLSDNPTTHLLIIAEADEDASASREAMAASESVINAVIKKPDSESNENENGTKIGAFSNRRTTEKKGANRWYYKQKGSALDDEEDQEGDAAKSPTITEEKPPQERKPAGGLIQDIEHSPIPDAETIAGKKNDPVDDVTIEEEDLTAEEREFIHAGKDDDNDGFRFTADSTPVRFTWEMDTDNRFQMISNDFGKTVGPRSAGIVNKTWEEVTELFELENGAEITALLKKEDTWSGKTVLWPIEGTDFRVPIDFAGLPSYGRNRRFEGFNGFGVIRLGDTVLDPNETGLNLDKETTAKPIGFLVGTKEQREETSENKPVSKNEAELPKDDNTKIVNLDKRRNTKVERALSNDDRDTFEEIAEKLSRVPPLSESRESDVSKSEDDAQTQPRENLTKIRTPKHDVDTSILSRLPIPVLVYRDNDLLFGNKGFFDLTGYADLNSLAQAGGVDALFGTPQINDDMSSAQIFHNNGEKLNVQAHLQRVPWDDHRAMLLTLRGETGGEKPDKTPDRIEQSGNTQLKPNLHSVGENVSRISNQTTARVKEPKRTVVSAPSSDSSKIRNFPPNAGEKYEAFGGLETEDLRNILDTATDGIIILSDEGIVRAINGPAEALFDIEPDKIVDRNFTKLLAVESHRSALDYISNIAGTGVASILNDGREIIGRTTKGGLIPLFMTIGKLEKTDACCAVMRDITHWKKAEEELVTAKTQAEMASAQKTEFLAKVSHEIRTPLNAIIGFSDIMIEERFGKIENDQYRGYLRDIHRSGNHVLELINDLLDISKIEAGKMDLEFDSCDLNTIVSETVALTQPNANKERVIIRTSLSSVVPKVVADPRSLRQIILNLVSNSIKYTTTGGQVIVSTVYEESGEVVLRVRDTGIGMSEIELKKALKPFQQIGTQSTTDQAGTGLGLPLTKAMVEANRALFHIESTPEEGTLVEIHFPSQRVLADR